MKIERVIISGGGSGGHIFPAIAIANELKRRNESVQILFVGDSILHNANFKVHTAEAYAADYVLNTRKPNKNFKYVARNAAKKFKVAVMHQ